MLWNDLIAERSQGVLFIYLERDIAPGDCLFDVITRNQAIEEFKIIVRRSHGTLMLGVLFLVEV